MKMSKHSIDLSNIFFREYLESVYSDDSISNLRDLLEKTGTILNLIEGHIDQLHSNNETTSEDDLLKKDLSKNQNPVYPPDITDRDKILYKRTLTLNTSHIILPIHGGYGFFLFLKIGHLFGIDVDDFLDYHSILYQEQTGKNFARFLHLIFREYSHLNSERSPFTQKNLQKIWATVEEWKQNYQFIESENITKGRLTVAQVAIAYKLREEQNQTHFHEDTIRFIRLIARETGYGIKSIKTALKAYDELGGFIHGKTKYDLDDYEVVREHFVSIKSEMIVQKIDKRIMEAKKFTKKS